MKYYRVKNFDQFQHYKSGEHSKQTVWIKLYYSLLNDYAFCQLDDASKFHLIGIFLLAGQSNNKIPADPNWIASRIGTSSPIDFSALVSSCFLEEYVARGTSSNALDDMSCRKRREDKSREEIVPADAAATSVAEPEPPKKSRKSSGTPSAHAQFSARFSAAWSERFGMKYAYQNAKDGAAVGRILKAVGDVEAAMRLVSAYFADSDPFIAKSGYTIAFLSSQINRYLAGTYKPPTKAQDSSTFERVVDDEQMAIALGTGGES